MGMLNDLMGVGNKLILATITETIISAAQHKESCFFFFFSFPHSC